MKGDFKVEEKPKILFINGVGHSGSTLLDILLNNHSDITGIGEAEKFGHKVIHPETICACGKDFIDCDFWKDYVKDNVFLRKGVRQINITKKDILLNKDNYYFLNYGEGKTDLNDYLENTKDLYNYVVDKSNKKVILDSTKNPVRSYVVSKNINDFDLLAIHLIRDSRGVMWSYKKKYGKSLFYLWNWFTVNLKTLIIHKKTHIKNLIIYYEDLVSDTENTLNKIFNFSGLKTEDVLNNSGSRHHIGGNAKVYNSKEIRISEDLAWKSNLNIFEKSAGLIFNVILKVLIKLS